MTLLSLKSFNEAGLFVADPYKLKMNLKLLYDVKIIPNPYKSLRYEIYNMGQDIGLKVGPRCFILSADERFKVVLEDEFNEREFTVVKATGNILFEKAVQIMRESSCDSTISASNRLVLELNSISWISYIYMLIWNYLCVLSPNFSSSGMLQSEKMPNDPRFLDYFNEKCDILCQCGVIPDRQKRILYKITYNTAEGRGHSFIVICGENHSFVLELSNQKFENNFHNCPSIRYIPKTEILKQDQDSDSIEKSANDFIQLAIETVAEMDKYDGLKNNCQNFVKNFLHELESSIKPPILEGDVAIRWLIFLITAICVHRMIMWFCAPYISKENPWDWWSFILPVAVTPFLLHLYRTKSLKTLILSLCILILLHSQLNN